MANNLTPLQVRNAKPGKYSDGNGLILVVGKTGAKNWFQRLTIEGKRRDIGLGSFKDIGLKEARAKALKNIQLVKQGIDPRNNKGLSGTPTFAQLVKEYVKLHRQSWRSTKHASQWETSLSDHVYESLGDIPISDITTANILDCIMPIWYTKHETAKRVVQRISKVMQLAIGKGYRNDNPAGETLKAILPKVKREIQHQRSIHYSNVPAAIKQVQSCLSHPITKLCFEFLVLTATRSSETRLATWNEIDLDNRVWSIPGNRMKNGKEHRIPLSTRAIAVLNEAKEINKQNEFVFRVCKGIIMDHSTLGKLLKVNGINAVPHGFRSSFRDWCEENTSYPIRVIETALAHHTLNKTESAYARTDLFNKRIGLMQDWSDYLSG